MSSMGPVPRGTGESFICAADRIPHSGAPDQPCAVAGAESEGCSETNGHRLHKPGVAGSSPAAASSDGQVETLLFDEPIGDYHADRRYFSKTTLWDFVTRGPQAFCARHIARTDNSRLDHPALTKGRLIHEWAELGSEAWWARVVIVPDDVLGAGGRRIKATERWEQEQLLQRPDAVLLLPEEAAAYRAQFEAIEANPVFSSLTGETVHREVSIRWKGHGGLPLKCRPDAIATSCVWDIKTTKEQNPLDTFWRSVVDYGYAFQQVLYLEGVSRAGFDLDRFVFLVTSTVPPYACHAVTLPERLIAKARRQVRSVIDEIQSRLEIDYWLPPDSGQITELFVPNRYLEERNGDRPSNAWVQ